MSESALTTMKKTNSKAIECNIALTQASIDAIYNFIGNHPAERAGILGADPDGIIRYFAPDHTAHCTAVAYDPDIRAMNRQIKRWKTKGIAFRGFAHSHPATCDTLSSADKQYPWSSTF